MSEEETEPASHRKPGPEVTIKNPVKFSMQLEQVQYDALTDYCRKHRVTKAVAVRQALDLLIKPEKDA